MILNSGHQHENTVC